MTDLAFRNPGIVAAILGTVYDAHEPVPWLELVDLIADHQTPWKTVENTIYDLVAYGAIHRIGRPGDRRRPDTRALRPTPLGRAWLDGELLPRPGEDHPPRTIDDTLDQADRLALEHAEALDLDVTVILRPEPSRLTPEE